jgi:NADH:ubiquinone oxidoreductase subunit 5 (subunit L)/multisubunit Na+/H+ antiporter MnhA subunit
LVFAGGETGASSWILGAGAAAFLLGAINAVASRTLRSLLAAQWAAQLGLLLVIGALAARGAIDDLDVFAAALNGVVSMLVLCLTLGQLAHVAGTEEIGRLPLLPASLRRVGLAYLLAGASAVGLPFTLGFTIRQTLMVTGLPAYLRPLLLAGSTLLLLALAVPLAAFFRSTALATRQPERGDEHWGIALPLGSLLAVLAPFRSLATLAGVEVAASPGSLAALSRVTVGLVVVLVVMVFVNRATKHAATEAALSTDGQVGWALPLSALGDLLAPLTPGPWRRGSHRVVEWIGRGATHITPIARPIAQRYYLGVMVAMAVAIVVLVAGGATP